jgi:acetylornithine deacetylase/succinyl-diaminopimelate desuccinylase-like protein
MVGIIQDNVEALAGFRPPPAVSIGSSDARFWRYRGFPAYIYGPRRWASAAATSRSRSTSSCT